MGDLALNKAKSLFCVLCVSGLNLLGCENDGAKPQAAPETAPAAKQVDAQKIEEVLRAAQEYMQAQQFEKAQAILMTLIERAPGEVRGYEMLGQVCILRAERAAQQREEARAADLRRQAYQHYVKAVEIEPHSAGLQHSAGTIAMAAGERSAALQHFRQARALDPKNPQYPLFEAQLLITEKQFEQAKDALRTVLDLDADQALAHASLAMIELELSNFAAALEHIGTARQIDPNELAFRAQEAKIHRRHNQPRKALELLVGLGETERAQEAIAFEIAAAYEMLGEPIKAARAWELVHSANPLAPRAWLAAVHVGEQMLKAGEREQAHLWLRQAQMAAPDAPEVKALENAFGD